MVKIHRKGGAKNGCEEHGARERGGAREGLRKPEKGQKTRKEGIYTTTGYLLDREVEHVLACLSPENSLVAQVMLHTGLRVSDVLSLTLEQSQKPRFWVTEAKTGKRRMVGLPEALREEIWRHALPGKSPWAFPGRDPAKHRTRQAVWKDVKRAAAAFRLPQNAGTHSFRKVYAVDLMEKYGDIERVRRALNHEREATTMIYAMADSLLLSKKLRKAARYGKRL